MGDGVVYAVHENEYKTRNVRFLAILYVSLEFHRISERKLFPIIKFNIKHYVG